MSKYKVIDLKPEELIENMKSEKKKQDAYKLLHMMTEISGREAKVWYPGIIGFGRYYYKYPTGQEGEASLLAFTPRDAKFSIHLAISFAQKEELLAKLGKHKTGAGCVYINKLDDVDEEVLRDLIRLSLENSKSDYLVDFRILE